MVLSAGLVLLVLQFQGCLTKEKVEQHNLSGSKQDRLFRKFIENPLLTVRENFAVLLDTDTLYLLNTNPENELPLPFELHLVLQDGSFINNDFQPSDFLVKPYDNGILQGIRIRKIPLRSAEFDSIRIGQFSRDSGTITMKWQKGVDLKELRGNGKQECGLIPSGNLKALHNWVFREHLNEGVFARVPNDFYLLLKGKTCWVITRKVREALPNMMFHYIRDDGGFDNYSFSFEDSSFQACLGGFSDLNITRINLEKEFNEYLKIRLGQYNSKGNIWVQTFHVQRILENDLLHYENEFD
jgi:hypothetical protein